MSQANRIRKITVANVIGEVPQLLRADKIPGVNSKNNGEEVVLMRVLALVSSAEPKETDFGQSWKFLGDFEATNMLDGQVYAAPVAYFPKVLEEALAAHFGAGSSDTVQFAGDIVLKVDHKSNVGYTYQFKPVVMKAADLLADLRATVNALPAPEATESKGGKKAK